MHKTYKPSTVAALALFWVVLAISNPLVAQDTEPPEMVAGNGAEISKPLTTADPTIAVDYLDLLLDPLTRDELEIEAKAWRDLVKEKVRAISEDEINTRDKNKEIKEIAETDDGSDTADITGEQKKNEKQEWLDALTKLREEKAALLERLDTVLNDWEAKGGESMEFRQYATAVSGIKVEVTDVSATWTAIRGWFTSKEGGVKWGLLLLKFAVIMFISWILASIAGRVVRKALTMNEGMSALLVRFINRMVRRSVLVIGFLVALSSLGVNVGALLALMGGGAFILGFALQDTLSNFAAGLMLLIYRPFDMGDAVEVAGVNGKVDNVSLVSTTIRTFDNKVILVPNSQVWGQIITNSTASGERRVDMVFGIGYGDDIDKAKEILEKIVKDHELVLQDPEPVIQLNELADSSVNFICRPWTNTADYWTVYWDVTRDVKKAFDAEGISIPFPQQDVYIHNVSS